MPRTRKALAVLISSGLVAGVAVTAIRGSEGAIRPAGFASFLRNVSVSNGGAPFVSDSQLLTTVSPNGDGLRDAAFIHFRLERAATVSLQVLESMDRATPPHLVWHASRAFAAGAHRLTWRPPSTIPAGTYLLRVTATDRSSRSASVGRLRRDDFVTPAGPVVRILGLDAGFTRPSYAPGTIATLVTSTDEPSFSLQLFKAGPESKPSLYAGYGTNALHGVAAGKAQRVEWRRNRNRTGALHIPVPVGASGLYFVRLRADDGRLGFAPFVLLPKRLGRRGVAVVFPTNTWEAYNHRDVDGDGWGDTWYAVNSINLVDRSRPYLHRGVPTRFLGYQLGFLRWLYKTKKDVDFLSDAEFETLRGNTLYKFYDLLVFLGHHEYMTTHAYDAVERFRDLGGNLMFTSTTNFLWRVDLRGRWMRRVAEWRDLGRPESGLIGVQYLSNDWGRHQGTYVVVGSPYARWAFRGTHLRPGGHFGHGGIEIDARTASSPPATLVLARMPNLHGPGLSAEMTYYSTVHGAKVFAAGTLNFGGTALEPPVSALLENVWRKLSQP